MHSLDAKPMTATLKIVDSSPSLPADTVFTRTSLEMDIMWSVSDELFGDWSLLLLSPCSDCSGNKVISHLQSHKRE